LVRDAAHPTWHLLNQSRLGEMTSNQLLINTSRGEVIDNAALLERLRGDDALSAVLDVWENEPRIMPELARLCWLGTSHIAGYSLEGKVFGVENVYHAVSNYLG